MNTEKCLWIKGHQIAAFIPTQGEWKNGFALWVGKLLIIWDWHGYRNPYLDVSSPIDMGYGD